MPLALLEKIKLNTNPSKKSLDYEDFSRMKTSKHIDGIYALHCKSLDSVQPLFNDGYPSLIIMPDPLDEVIITKDSNEIVLKSVWTCCGVCKRTSWKVSEELDYILVIRFNPNSFYSLFDIHPSIFQDMPVYSFEDIGNKSWTQIIGSIYTKRTIVERIEYINKIFNTDNLTENEFPPLLKFAIKHIEEKEGNISVTELLNVLGIETNYKWLQRIFIKYLGISPKKYISLQRFIHAYGHWDNFDATDDLMSVALHCGYYDNSHLLKDLKKYIGISPSIYCQN